MALGSLSVALSLSPRILLISVQLYQTPCFSFFLFSFLSFSLISVFRLYINIPAWMPSAVLACLLYLHVYYAGAHKYWTCITTYILLYYCTSGPLM